MEVGDGGGGSCRSCGHGRGTAAEETECGICLDELSAHREARLQPRDPNGWGATRCCKSLFHYRCLHAWLNNDSEVETSRGTEPINTACPGCRGFVSKSASRMLQ
uniref:RING-type domain-containing protein n=1 Tax=Emiliania huxleyi TaxID=2903 RepID=A0A7S3WE49_EMIHU